MPCRASSREVTRVSSAAIDETSARMCRARAVMSSRFPIGVATTNSLLTYPHPARPLRGGATFPSDWGRESNSVEPGPDTFRDLRARTHETRSRGQHVKEGPAVVASKDAVVEDHHGSAVGGAADQPAESLLEPQRGLWKSKLRERIADLLC